MRGKGGKLAGDQPANPDAFIRNGWLELASKKWKGN
jgi:hypothetical protein